jgi:hypothetical protein
MSRLLTGHIGEQVRAGGKVFRNASVAAAIMYTPFVLTGHSGDPTHPSIAHSVEMLAEETMLFVAIGIGAIALGEEIIRRDTDYLPEL